jgi:hypothetical protein
MSNLKLSSILTHPRLSSEEKIRLYQNLLENGELSGNYQPDVKTLTEWMKMSDSELMNILRENEEIQNGAVLSDITRTIALLTGIAGEEGTMDSYIWFIQQMSIYPLRILFNILNTIQLHGEPMGFLSYLIVEYLSSASTQYLPVLPKNFIVELFHQDEESDLTTYSYRLGESVFEGIEVATKEELFERWKEDIARQPRLVQDIVEGREGSLVDFFENARNLAKANWTLLTDPTDSFQIEMVKKFYGVYNHLNKALLLTDKKQIIEMYDVDTRSLKKLSISIDGAIEMLMDVGRAAFYFSNHGLYIRRIEFVQIGIEYEPYITQFTTNSERKFDTSFLDHFYSGSDKIDEIQDALREGNFDYFAPN